MKSCFTLEKYLLTNLMRSSITN